MFKNVGLAQLGHAHTYLGKDCYMVHTNDCSCIKNPNTVLLYS